MVTRRDHSLRPDFAVLPGDTLLETIEAIGMSQAELAERMGRPRKTINEIIKGKAAITPETAIQLERVLGVTASFWNNLERNYQEDRARLAEAERLEAQQQWLEAIPYREMAKLTWIPRMRDRVKLFQAVLDFFGVASPEAWESRWTSPQAAFRKSPAFAAAPGSVAAWLRKGELESLHIKCAPYNEQRLRQALPVLRSLTLQPPDVFVPQLQRICAEAGVAVVFIPELPRLPVSGATRWLTHEKALIQLSLRYKTDDHLWFTLFHEVAHILLHNKKTVFLEGKQDSTELEDEANRFAANQLISESELQQLVAQRPISEAGVVNFATRIGVAPGIVVGRLQHDKVIPFTHLNGLKRHFRWAS